MEDEGEQAEVMALMHSGPEDTRLSWKDAVSKCQETDSHLAQIKSMLINDAVQSLVMGGTGAWIGLSDKQTEGTWKFADGKKFGRLEVERGVS